MFGKKNGIVRSNKHTKLIRLFAVIAILIAVSALIAYGWQKSDDEKIASGKENTYGLPDAFVSFARLIGDFVEQGKEKLSDGNSEEFSGESERIVPEEEEKVTTIVIGSSESETSSEETSSEENNQEPIGGIAIETDAADEYSFSDALFLGDYFVWAVQDNGWFKYSSFISASGLDMNTIQTKKNFKLEDKYVIATDYLASYENVSAVYITFSAESISWMDCPTFIKKFSAFLDSVEAAQPDSVIYVQSILPINKEKAEKREYSVTNEKIDEINQSLLEIAEERHIWYLDINPSFKNEKGELADDWTTNGIRLERAAYIVWKDYIETHKMH